MRGLLSTVFALAGLCSCLGASLPYRDATRSVSERVEDLLRRMTVEEKLLQLGKLRGWNAYVRGGDGIVYSNAFEKGFATNPLRPQVPPP